VCAAPWPVVALWIVLLAGATVGHRALGGVYSDSFSLPGSPSQQGSALLKAHEPGAGGQDGQLVFTVSSGSLAEHQSAIEKAVAQVRDLPHVLSASDPLTGGTTSKDGRTAYDVINFDTNPAALGPDYLTRVAEAVTPARSADVTVNYGGALGQAARPAPADATSELTGIAVAIVVLLIGFGSLYAAGLPILTAVAGMATGLGVLGMLAAAFVFPTVSPTLAVMMGLGVGIDYALFQTTRHRQQVMDGADPAEAAGRTAATSGRAVLVAAVTVIVAMLGLYACAGRWPRPTRRARAAGRATRPGPARIRGVTCWPGPRCCASSPPRCCPACSCRSCCPRAWWSRCWRSAWESAC
jgi:putative drug exporter of the RND superfamily